MEDETRLHIHSDWQHLAQHVLQVARRWEKLWTDALAEIGETLDLQDLDDSSVALIWHLRWLVPLAEELQKHPVLHKLFPVVHHANIDLRLKENLHLPGVLLYAPSAEMFEATLLTISAAGDTSAVPLGRGDIQAIAYLLEKLVQKAANEKSCIPFYYHTRCATG